MNNRFDRIRAACLTDGLKNINEKKFDQLYVFANDNMLTGEFYKIKNEVKTSVLV